MARLFIRTSSQYLKATPTALSAGYYPCTMSCWFNPAGLATNQVLVGCSSEDDNQYHGLWLAFRGADVGDFVQARGFDGTIRSAVSSTGLLQNAWYYLTAVFTAANDWSIFVNGGSKGTQNVACNPVSIDNTTIGAVYYFQGAFNIAEGFADGSICLPAIWNCALDDYEVKQLASGLYLPTDIRRGNLVGDWPLHPRIGDVDLGPYHYNLTAYNNPTWTSGPPILQERVRRKYWVVPFVDRTKFGLAPIPGGMPKGMYQP